MAATYDGSTGLVPGRTDASYAATVVTMGAATRLEILNDHAELPLWFAINPAGNDFVANTVGGQYVRPGEWLEVTTSGSPVVVLKSSRPVKFQIRTVA